MAKKFKTLDDVKSHYDESKGIMTLSRGNRSVDIMVWDAERVKELTALADQIYAKKMRQRKVKQK